MKPWFGNKQADGVPAIVHPEVGATLTTASAFPEGAQPAPVAAGARCREATVTGSPPTATISAPQPGGTVNGWTCEGLAGQPALAIVNPPAGGAFEIWEAGSSRPGAPWRARPVARPAANTSDTGRLVAVGCGPAGQLLLAVAYDVPKIHSTLFQYDITANRLESLGDVEPNPTDLSSYFEVTVLTPATALVRYDSDVIRLGYEKYLNTRTHFRLYTPRHPGGLEVLRVESRTSAVRRWAVAGSTLWIQSTPASADSGEAPSVRSLDLAGVLK